MRPLVLLGLLCTYGQEWTSASMSRRGSLASCVLYLRSCPKLLQHQYTEAKFTTDGINDPSMTRLINLAQHLS